MTLLFLVVGVDVEGLYCVSLTGLSIASLCLLVSQSLPVVTLIPSGLPSRILTCTELKGHRLCLF